MFESNSDYDGGVNTFSPHGRILQVEYAMKAVNNGSTILGIRCTNGVLIAVEKPLNSPLIIPSSIEKIHQIDQHICCASCGVVSDARALVDKARAEAQNHFFSYNESIPVKSVAQALGDTILGFGKGNDMPSRPFGVAILIAGCDDPDSVEDKQSKSPTKAKASKTKLKSQQPQVISKNECQLYLADPAGSFSEYAAKALGSGSESAQQELEEKWTEDMDIEEGKRLILKVLKQVMKEDIDEKRVELAEIRSTPDRDKRFRIVEGAELKALITEIA